MAETAVLLPPTLHPHAILSWSWCMPKELCCRPNMISDVIDALSLPKAAFAGLTQLLQIVLKLTVTTASCKRCFSPLKCIKIYHLGNKFEYTCSRERSFFQDWYAWMLWLTSFLHHIDVFSSNNCTVCTLPVFVWIHQINEFSSNNFSHGCRFHMKCQ